MLGHSYHSLSIKSIVVRYLDEVSSEKLELRSVVS